MLQARLFILALVTTLFCLFGTASASAVDAPPAPGASQQQQAPPSQSQQQPPKPAARREDIEPKTLPEALAELQKARADRDAAETKLGAEEADHGKTKGLLASTIETARTATQERDQARTELATAIEERDAERKAHGRTKEMLTLAEAALQVKGIKADQVVPPSAEETGKGILEKFMAATPGERTAMLRTDGDAIYKAARAAGAKIG